MMKRLSALALTGIVLLVGCQNQHLKNKQEALSRWNESRVQLTVDIAHQQFRSGQLEKATRTVQQAIQIDGQYVPAHLLLGQIYLEQNRIIPAQQCFETCLELQSSHAEANYNLGIVLEKRGLTERAMDCYKIAWEARPGHSPYLLALVETLVEQNKLQQALDLLVGYINSNEGDASVYVAAGNILVALDRSAEAVGMFRDAASLAPENEAITESLAFALLKADRASEALSLFERLEEQAQQSARPFSWSNRLAMGDCYMKLSRFYHAQRCFEYVIEHDGANPAVWTRLAQTAMARDDLKQGRVWAERALTLKPDYPDALTVLAYIAFKQQEYQQAEEILRRIIADEDDNGLAHCLLGQALEARGQIEQAKACYRRALEIDPQDRLAQKLTSAIENTRIGEKATHDKL
jgi:tetratricopeptide (TPR) repeat protein